MSQQVETQNQAVSLLIQGAQVAQKRGAFDLREAALLSEAIDFLVPPPAPEEEELSSEEEAE
jgi:hypothetical protein